VGGFCPSTALASLCWGIVPYEGEVDRIGVALCFAHYPKTYPNVILPSPSWSFSISTVQKKVEYGSEFKHR
jgi:hypothetical protein